VRDVTLPFPSPWKAHKLNCARFVLDEALESIVLALGAPRDSDLREFDLGEEEASAA
jgi:hypothetical protein